MRSTSLEIFTKEHGVNRVIELWGVSQQAIDKAIKSGRDIQIVELDKVIEVIESKVLSRVRIK